MPLFIVLTFQSPTGPQQSLPCGTQSVGWSLRLTEGEAYDENPNIPREKSLLEYCFANIKQASRCCKLWTNCVKKHAWSISHAHGSDQC